MSPFAAFDHENGPPKSRKQARDDKKKARREAELQRKSQDKDRSQSPKHGTDDGDVTLLLDNGEQVVLDKHQVANPEKFAIRSVELPGGQIVYLDIENKLIRTTEARVAANAAGQPLPEDDGKVCDPISIRRSGDSHNIPALVHLNGALIKGYSPKTLAHVGAGPGKGLTTTVDYRAAQYSPPSITISCSIRDGGELQSILKIVAYLGSATAINRETISTDQTDWLRSAFSLGQDDHDMIAGLLDNNKPVKTNPFEDLSAFGPDCTEENMEPAQLMLLKCASVNSVQLALNRGDVAFHWNDNVRVSYCQDIHNTLKALFASSEQFHFTITTDDSPLATEMWDNLLQFSGDAHVFNPLMSNCNFRYQDLSFSSFNLEASRPLKSTPRVYVFKDQTHQTCALIGGSTDAINYEVEIAKKMETVEIPFVASASPYELWTSTENDLVTYGILADNSPTEMTLFCLVTANYRLPPEDKTCLIKLRQKEVVRQRPDNIEMTRAIHQSLSEQVESIVRNVASEIDLAYDNKEKQVEGMRQNTEAEQEKYSDAKDDLTHFRHRLACKLLAERLTDFVNRPTEEARRLVNNVDGEPRLEVERTLKIVSAVDLGISWLNMHLKNEDADMVIEIGKWIRSNGVPQQSTPEAEELLEVPARRLPLPAGISGRVAMFSAVIPKDERWASCYTAPPKNTGLPFWKIQGTLQDFCDKLSTGRVPKKYLVNGTIQPSVLTSTAKHEASANYSANFNKHAVHVKERDVFAIFGFEKLVPPRPRPGYQGQWAALLRDLKRTTDGIFSLTGCPGSGKSYIADALTSHVARTVPQCARGEVAPEAFETDFANDINTHDPLPDEYEDINDAHRDSVRERRREEERQRKIEISKAVSKVYRRTHRQKIAAYHNTTMPDESDDDDDEEPAASTDEEQTAGGAEPGTAEVAGDSANEPWTEHGTDTGAVPVQRERVEKGQVLVTTFSRKITRDALERGNKFDPNVKRMRCYPYEKEMRNLLSTQPSGPRQTDVDSRFASLGEKSLQIHKNNMQKDSWEDVSPASDPHSVSEQAKRVLEQHPDRWLQLRQGLSYKDCDLTLWKKNKAEAMKDALDLINFTIAQAGIVYATPAAIASCASRFTSFMPDMIVIDEAQNLNEAATFIPMAKYPRAAFVLIMGDVNQSTLIPSAAEDGEYQDLFGYQHATSFLARLAMSNKIDFTLKYTHRAFGLAFEIPRQVFYRETMSVVHQHSNVTRLWNSFFATMMGTENSFRPKIPSIMIDPKNSIEELYGYSFINKENARLVQKLVVQLYQSAPVYNTKDLYKSGIAGSRRQIRRGSVLIVTAYAAQKNLLRGYLKELQPNEAPLGLIDVRTIDESPSHQADVVIIDLPRTTRGVFQNNHNRLCIGSTRAQAATIWIAAEEGIKGPWGEKVASMHEENGTLLELNYKMPLTKICDRCNNHGHEHSSTSPCHIALECNGCKALGLPCAHTARNCPRSDQHSPASLFAGRYSKDLANLKPVPHPDNQPPSIIHGVSSKQATSRDKVSKVNKTLGDNRTKAKKRERFRVAGAHPEGESSAMGAIQEALMAKIEFPADGSGSDEEEGPGEDDNTSEDVAGGDDGAGDDWVMGDAQGDAADALGPAGGW
ncbi:uncharacterized protein F5Z01DRAFT_688635 [Emericellopsis atlantica]|uniref:DNA2/NAM7 helicase-like C-terminal domain-containing protein n=1 Tax=Emericellopsis atlantica TaxID=2614577 RepID=A0A9P8CNI4_9HYPO|nr:uncharacterized protein F5Z01DRAFT_688635 [Emericellopsis atlantica]KAG9253167.1 hypothetical protein F5Z01DRAFT_688635 [Emericellopsis atlantica]